VIQGFDRFRDAIAALPPKPCLEKADLLTERFRLFGDGEIESYYAPFDYVNRAAKVVLVGVTPGWSQMERAFKTACNSLREGLADSEVLRLVKRTAGFAGPMRKLLVGMLDGIELQHHMRIASCSELFDSAFDSLHCTSAVSAPTFKNGANYTGQVPGLTKNPLLRRYVMEALGPELASIPDALIVPLGAAASSAVRLVIEQGVVLPERCLIGFPHPSGANGWRGRLFAANREQMKEQVRCWFEMKSARDGSSPALVAK